MNVVVRIPDDLAAQLGDTRDLGRRALEALALQAYRAGQLTREELRRLLGYETKLSLDGFLKAQGVIEAITAEEVDQDLRDIERAGL